MKDGLIIFLFASVVYVATLLPGVGWGAEAELQTQVLLQARTTNVLIALLSALTLVVVFFTISLLVSRKISTFGTVIALGFSQSFYLHAVRPSFFALKFFFFASFIFFAIEFLLVKKKRSLLIAIVFGVMMLFTAIQDGSVENEWLLFLPMVIYLIARLFTSSWIIFPFLFIGCLLTSGIDGLIFMFIALQFPFIGLVLMGYGFLRGLHRYRPLIEFLLLSIPGSVFRHAFHFPESFGSMTYAVIASSLLIGLGIDFLFERLTLRREKIPIVSPLLISALVAFPLMTAGALAWYVRASGTDHRLNFPPATLWHDPVFYSLWPAKNGQGGEQFVNEAETLPPSLVFVDPDILPVVIYAQRVEKRLLHIEALSVPPESQSEIAQQARNAGKKVFLAGTNPRFYALNSLGEIGEIFPAGRMYEWK